MKGVYTIGKILSNLNRRFVILLLEKYSKTILFATKMEVAP